MNVAHEMRGLILSSDRYPPFRVDVTVLFGRELSRRGMQVDWLLQSQEACARAFETEWGGGRVFVGPTDAGQSLLRRLKKHWRSIAHDMRVLGIARRGRYDFIQVKDKVLATLPALVAARRNRAAFVYWLSFPHPEASLYLAKIGAARYPMLYRIRGWFFHFLLYKLVLPRADHVFVQSEQMKTDLASYGIPAKRMTAVPMGIQFEDFRGIGDGIAIEPDLIAYLGTLAGERRIDFLVRCLALVIKRRPAARLLLVGDGDRPGDVDDIRKEAEKAGIADRVEITGFRPRTEALGLVAKAAVCVSPFYPTPILNSTSPTKLVEYMALGRPVVANDHPEQRLVLEQSGGGLCVPYDETRFAEAIVRILEAPDEAAAMGVRGRAFVEAQRDYGRIADDVASTYRSVLESCATRT